MKLLAAGWNIQLTCNVKIFLKVGIVWQISSTGKDNGFLERIKLNRDILSILNQKNLKIRVIDNNCQVFGW